jgi:hypothetical protein
MRKQTSILMAAAMTVAGLSFMARADDNTNAANSPANNPAAVSNNGDLSNAQAVSDVNAAAIRQRLAHVTQDALTGTPINDLRQDFCASAASRFTDANIKSDDLSQVSDQIRKAWHDKYGDDLQLKDDAVAFADFKIYQGDIADQARTAGDKMLPPADTSGQQTQTGTQKGRIDPLMPPYSTAIKENPADRATVVIASTRHPANLNVSLVNEGTQDKQWRLDVPKNLDAQGLHDNLLRELTAVRDHQADWPSDENQAFRHVTERVLAAIDATDMADANGARPAGETIAPDNGNANPNDNGMNSSPNSLGK